MNIKFLSATLSLFLLFSPASRVHAQPKTPVYGKLSVGRFVVGHGDIPAYSITIELSKNVLQRRRRLMEQLQLGAEFSFEAGAENPTVNNPTVYNFYHRSFYQVSYASFTPKATWYPFSGFFKGFNIAAGVSVAYTLQSFEARASAIVYAPGVVIRMTQLDYDNGWLIGYRVSAGYEFFFRKKKWLAGFRVDVTGYSNADVNAIPAVKVGYRF